MLFSTLRVHCHGSYEKQSERGGNLVRSRLWAIIVALLCSAATSSVRAESADVVPKPAIQSAPWSPAPEVRTDGMVTFRYHSSEAKSVSVSVEGAPAMAMTQDRTGVWTLTTPLKPNYYAYHFTVDGISLNDPANPVLRPNLMGPSSVVHVPGTPPELWDRTDIPHGYVHHHLYRSQLANDDRDLYVYTPPGYNATRKQAYPVLYLLHGYSDDAAAWIAAGQANLILDRLISDGKVEPMIVVMPLAYGTMDMIRAGWNVWSGGDELIKRNQIEFSDQLLHEILPFAEAQYNIARDPAHRAIAGLSMGGGESLYTGLNFPEVFGYVGGFSSAIANRFDTDYNGHSKASTRLLWISCGAEDDLHAVNMQFGDWAKTNIKDRVIIGDTPGMHNWLTWRNNLIAFAPLLFRGTA